MFLRKKPWERHLHQLLSVRVFNKLFDGCVAQLANEWINEFETKDEANALKVLAYQAW